MVSKSRYRQIQGWYLSESTFNSFHILSFRPYVCKLLTAPSNNLQMTVDMQTIYDYQRRIVWLIGANDPQKAAYQITQYHVRMMLTATVTTEAYVVYCTDTCGAILSGLQSYIWPAV
jgi:hypothetical protein